MKVKANPTIVGIFVIGALAIAVLGLIFLGQSAFRGNTFKVVTYFDETVNGLELGAAVKFRGVKIGQVSELKIFLTDSDQETEMASRIPVVYEIERSQLVKATGLKIDLSDEEVLKTFVERGLRARIARLSFITGLMYLELDFVDPQEYPATFYNLTEDIEEIPSFPGLLAELGANLTDTVNDITQIDFKGMADQLDSLLKNVNTEIEKAEIAELTVSMRQTADALTAFLESEDLNHMLVTADESMMKLGKLAENLDTSVGPTRDELLATLQSMNETLTSLKQASGAVQLMLRPQSSLRSNLDQTLMSVEEMAEAFRSLADFIERNPSALISGRKGSE